MTLIRCYRCRAFFPKKQGECPDCGAPVREVNQGLMAGRWSAALNAQAEHAVKHT